MCRPGRKSTVVALALALAFGVSGCDGRAALASHMARGEKYLSENNLPKAQIEFRNALQIAPRNAEASLMSGTVAEKLGDLRGAAALYQAAIDAKPDYPAAQASLGRLFVFAGTPRRALDVAVPALLKHPADADLLAVRGAAQAQLGNRSEALADAERAQRIAPNNENAVALLASLYEQRGETGRAIDVVRAALEGRSLSSIDMRAILADLYQRDGERALAEAELLHIIALRPGEAIYRDQLVRLYVAERRLDDAERLLREAIARAPDRDGAVPAYVAFLSAHRSPDAGERALARLIAQRPNDYELRLGLASLQQRSGSLEAASQTLRRVLTDAGASPAGLSARNHLAGILITQGRPDEAADLLSQVLSHNTGDADALWMRASLALQRDDPAAAIADLREILRNRPQDVTVMRALARAYFGNGQSVLAEGMLQSATAAAPADPAPRIELAQLYVRTRRLDSAILLLGHGIEASPKDVALREALIRARLAKGDFSAAGADARELRALAPQRALGAYLEALIAQAQGRRDEAQGDLERALKLEPASVEVLAALSRLDVASGNAGRAIARAQSAVANQPDDAGLRNLLGELYLNARDPGRAQPELARAIELAPRWALPYRILARAQSLSGDDSAAVRTCERALSTVGLDTALVAELAGLYERQGRVEDAIRQYQSLRQHRPGTIVAENNLAVLLAHYRKDRASLDLARDLTARFITSDDPALLDTAGWVRFKEGELTEALAILHKAVKRSPDSSVLRYHLGMAELQAGERDLARADLRSALSGSARFQGSDEARSALASLTSSGG